MGDPATPLPSNRRGVLRRWLGRSRWRKWAALLGAVAVLLGAGAWGGHRYAQTSAGFCLSCHADQEPTVQASVHRDSRCQDCHEASLRDAFGQLLGGTPHGAVTTERCRQCHVDGRAQASQISATLGHRAHALGALQVACTRCHAGAPHDPQPHQGACRECHGPMTIHVPAKAEWPCLRCHNFLARTGPDRPPVAQDCRRCHGGVAEPDRSVRFAEVQTARAVWDQDSHGRLTSCSLCHNPHQAEAPARLAGADCLRCHRLPAGGAGHASIDQDDCASCHEVHAPTTSAGQSCTRCHESEAKATGTEAAAHSSCLDCHPGHGADTQPASCRGCHEQSTKLVTARAVTEHRRCTACHVAHGTPGEAKPCGDCHQTLAGHGHPSCLTCHEAHEDGTIPKDCSSCHGRQLAELAAGTPEHRGPCTTCHGTHAVRGASTHCRRCHEAQAQTVSAVSAQAHRDCGACHQPHGFAKGDQASCARCHGAQSAAVTSAAIGGHATCMTCHDAHGATARGCATCHGAASKLGLHAKGDHQSCTACHDRHTGAVAGRSSCLSCHQDQKSHHPKAKRCSTCHAFNR